MKLKIKKILRWAFLDIYKTITEILYGGIFYITLTFPKIGTLSIWKWTLVTIKPIAFFDAHKLLKVKPFKIEYTSSSPKYFDEDTTDKQYKKYYEDNVYIAYNATVNNNSSLILFDDDLALYKPSNISENSNYKLTDGSVLFYKNKQCLIRSNKEVRHIDHGINLVINYSLNYYHIIFELIPKFYYLKQLDINNDIPIIADSSLQEIPNFNFLLKFFSGKRKILYTNKFEQIKVDNLYILPEATIIPPNFRDITLIKGSDFLFDFKAIKWIREKLLENKPNNSHPKRIFLSRQNATYRRECNEDEVFGILRNYDFEKVYPEKMTISEQVSVFNSAEFIVGVSGAAFSNLLFCSKGCNVICLTNYNLDISIFSTIAKWLDINFSYFYDRSKSLTSKSDLHDSFKVELHRLREYIETK
ncbi:glycosyltransferase family 61 protein [Perlabentimonas gracilis]|uniref:glycosyltransferase family 61 protein n=1 Tax=Perlabentimonas gracilis TaxID=2715279 RepID=UPI0014095E94|nr:glycosyltransferase family 61 protein [Perlabentimonas gracilis]NHB69842.1 glycosyltransferase family 61 protein [Perlabentimonas gracilis]